MRNLLLALLLIAVAAVWGWTFVVVKDAIAAYGIISFLAVRFAIAAVAIGGVAVRRITKKSLLAGGAIGIVLMLAYLYQTVGLYWTTPTNCGLITGLFAVFALAANRILFGVRTGRMFWAAIAISLVGLALLTGSGPTPLAMGDLMTLIAAACFGLHVALLDRFAKRHDATVLAFAQVASAAILFWIIWPMSDSFAWPTPSVWFALLITGVLATAVAFIVQTRVQQRLPAVRTAVIISTEPVFAALFGFLLAGDRLTAVQILGAVLMVGAIVLAEVRAALLAGENRPPHLER